MNSYIFYAINVKFEVYWQICQVYFQPIFSLIFNVCSVAVIGLQKVR